MKSKTVVWNSIFSLLKMSLILDYKTSSHKNLENPSVSILKVLTPQCLLGAIINSVS